MWKDTQVQAPSVQEGVPPDRHGISSQPFRGVIPSRSCPFRCTKGHARELLWLSFLQKLQDLVMSSRPWLGKWPKVTPHCYRKTTGE